MSYMCTVVDTETDGNDEIVAGHSVNGEIPKMHETPHIGERENDTQEDQKGDSEVS